MNMYHNPNSGSLSIILLIFLLVISVSNYYRFYKIENQLQAQSSSIHPNEIYQSDAMKEMRRASLLSAQINRKALWIASKNTKNNEFYQSVKLEAHCEQKERIGEKGDGGKYVCNSKKVKKDCTLLSLGLNNQIGYDKHIYEVTGKQCTILGADIAQQREKTQEAYEIMNGKLFVGKIPDNITIPEILEKSGRREVEILKIDIEKGEFTALEPLLKEFYVCQILIEIHGLPSDHLRMLQTMSK
ncbi:unnamed protein product [Caenorhabditis brenneri]